MKNQAKILMHLVRRTRRPLTYFCILQKVSFTLLEQSYVIDLSKKLKTDRQDTKSDQPFLMISEQEFKFKLRLCIRFLFQRQ